MKGFNILLVIFAMVLSCKGQNTTEVVQAEEQDMQSFGAQIEAANAKDSKKMLDQYTNMGQTDSVQTKFTAKVKEVCRSKGCWMKLELENGEEAMVRFKDYGFFMPKDIAGKEVIVNGIAFVEAMSVEDQKHFAEDGGATPEELAKITEPKRTYGFEADGVLLKN